MPKGFLYHHGWPTNSPQLLNNTLKELRHLLSEDSQNDSKWACTDRSWGGIFLLIGLLGDENDLPVLRLFSKELSNNPYDMLNLAKALGRLGDIAKAKTVTEKTLSTTTHSKDSYYEKESRKVIETLNNIPQQGGAADALSGRR